MSSGLYNEGLFREGLLRTTNLVRPGLITQFDTLEETLTRFSINGVEAALALDFIGGEYRTANTSTTFADAFTGTSPKLTYSTAAGSNSTMVNSEGKIVWAPHNLALNSATPATQTIAVRSGAQYTVRVTGAGSMALSGAGTGTATDGSPATITASTTSLTITLTGSLDTVAVYRSDLGGMHPVPGAATGFEYYVPTNGNAEYLPRVGHHVYNGSTWVNEGLLIESEPRTNLLVNSNDFSAWSNVRSVDTEDGDLGPDDLGSATRLSDDSSSGTNTSQLVRNVTVATSTTYTFSVFLKADQLSIGQIRLVNFTTPGNGSNYFDLSAGTVGTVQSGVTATIEAIGDGWHRCAVTFTTDATDTTGSVIILPAEADGSTDVTLDGTSSILVYGAQLEQASTPSSYIPTNGSTVTRGGQSLVVPPAEFGWDSSAVSIQMDGRMTYADEDTGASATFVTAGSFVTGTTYVIETVGTTNFTAIGAEANTVGTVFTATGAGSGDGTALPMTAQLAKWGGVGMALDTHDTATGGFVFTTDDGNTEYVETSDTALTPGINVPFNISSRHGSTFVNGAVDGTALTGNTTPTALPDLSGTDLEIAYDFMGTIGTFRQFAGDIGDDGLEEATT